MSTLSSTCLTKLWLKPARERQLAYVNRSRWCNRYFYKKKIRPSEWPNPDHPQNLVTRMPNKQRDKPRVTSITIGSIYAMHVMRPNNCGIFSRRLVTNRCVQLSDDAIARWSLDPNTALNGCQSQTAGKTGLLVNMSSLTQLILDCFLSLAAGGSSSLRLRFDCCCCCCCCCC